MKIGKQIIIIVIILILITIFFAYIKINKQSDKTEFELLSVKADNLFGTNKCENSSCKMITDDFNEQECELCFEKFMGSSSYSICDDCSQNLNRCNVCGKKR